MAVAWRRFVERNAAVVAATGLPPLATASVAEWDHFLIHGYVARDPGGFAVDQLSPAQYASPVELTANYFTAGYEFYTPIALRVDDQTALRARFGGR
jgi:hypothetical protein